MLYAVSVNHLGRSRCWIYLRKHKNIFAFSIIHQYLNMTGCWDLLSWWRHQMETFSTLLALCAGNSAVTGEFPAQRPVTRSFDVLFDLRLNKRLSKQSRGQWFDMPLGSLWRHCNVKENTNVIWCGQCHGCWSPSDARNQGISSYGIDLVEGWFSCRGLDY